MTSRDEPAEAKCISDVIIDLVLVRFGFRWGIKITHKYQTDVTSKDWLWFKDGE